MKLPQLYSLDFDQCQLEISLEIPLSQQTVHCPPILAQSVENRVFGQRFELYSWDGLTRYAGQYSELELAYLVGRFPRGSSPSVAQFMSVAESMIRGGLARGAAWILERRHPSRWANAQRIRDEAERQAAAGS